jgi:predicted O-linked N-acetylglucosamine transferase (SPINDLY family)
MSRLTTQQVIDLALQHHRGGRLEEAENIYRQVIQQQPDNHDALQLMGALAYQIGRHENAVELISRAIALAPNIPHYHNNLGSALMALEHVDDAITAFRRSLELDDRQPDAHNNLADALSAKGEWQSAAEHYRAALRLRSEWPEAHNNLGHVLHNLGLAHEAAGEFRTAIEQFPAFAEAHTNLGNVLLETGQIGDAIESYRTAVRLKPESPAPHSNLVYALHFDAGISRQTIFDEHLRWAAVHAKPLAAEIRPLTVDRDPRRRLRVGYVSQDFRDHPVGRFMRPILASHDRQNFEIHCFSDVFLPDEVTAGLRGAADHWHDSRRLSDAQLAEWVREKQIDVLVDLAGHSAVNRLLTFARKPAPVQVTYLGYPDTTGLATMDYRITDALADPAGESDAFHTEKLVRLPHGFLCYSMDDLPPVAPPPSATSDSITFGSFNNLAKLSPEVMTLWARILRDTPRSRLLIKSQLVATGDLIARFASHGIDPQRLLVLAPNASHHEHLAAYAQVDIALDTFPYNGTTTTLDALAMGVPVVTLAGATHASRVGVSILTHAGLTDFIAADGNDYVRIATDLASDRSRLTTLRNTLSQTIARSSLSNPLQLVSELETAYRDMWIAFTQHV